MEKVITLMANQEFKLEYSISLDKIKSQIFSEISSLFGDDFLNKIDLNISFEKDKGIVATATIKTNTDKSTNKIEDKVKDIAPVVSEPEPSKIEVDNKTTEESKKEEDKVETKEEDVEPVKPVSYITKKSKKNKSSELCSVIITDGKNTIETSLNNTNKSIGDLFKSPSDNEIRDLTDEEYMYLRTKVSFQLSPSDVASMRNFEKDANRLNKLLYKDTKIEGVLHSNPIVDNVNWGTNSDEREYMLYWATQKRLEGWNVVYPVISSFEYEGFKVNIERILVLTKDSVTEQWIKHPRNKEMIKLEK